MRDNIEFKLIQKKKAIDPFLSIYNTQQGKILVHFSGSNSFKVM